MNHVFPLRPGLRVTLVLPADLLVAEAQRINGFVSALAFTDETPVPTEVLVPDTEGGIDD